MSAAAVMSCISVIAAGVMKSRNRSALLSLVALATAIATTLREVSSTPTAPSYSAGIEDTTATATATSGVAGFTKSRTPKTINTNSDISENRSRRGHNVEIYTPVHGGGVRGAKTPTAVAAAKTTATGRGQSGEATEVHQPRDHVIDPVLGFTSTNHYDPVTWSPWPHIAEPYREATLTAVTAVGDPSRDVFSWELPDDNETVLEGR